MCCVVTSDRIIIFVCILSCLYIFDVTDSEKFKQLSEI